MVKYILNIYIYIYIYKYIKTNFINTNFKKLKKKSNKSACLMMRQVKISNLFCNDELTQINPFWTSQG